MKSPEFLLELVVAGDELIETVVLGFDDTHGLVGKAGGVQVKGGDGLVEKVLQLEMAVLRFVSSVIA